MKNVVFFCLLFISFCTYKVEAQKVNAKQGDLFSAPNAVDILQTGGTTAPDLLSLPDGKILVYKQGKNISSLGDKQTWLYVCDKNMNIVQKETKVKLSKGCDGKNLLRFGGKIYIVGFKTIYDHKLTKVEKQVDVFYFRIVLFEVNLTDLSVGDEISLQTSDFNRSTARDFAGNHMNEIGGGYALFVSPNQENLVLLGNETICEAIDKSSENENIIKVSGYSKYHLCWMDKNRKVVNKTFEGKKDLSIPISKKMTGFLNNNGVVYINAIFAENKETNKNVLVSFDRSRDKYSIESKADCKKPFNLINEDYAIYAKMALNTAGDKYESIEYGRLKLSDGEFEVQEVDDVNKMVNESVNKTKKKSKDYFGPRENETTVFVNDDLSATLVTEITTYRSNGPYFHYYNFDVFVTQIDPSGKVEWTKRVPMSQDLAVLRGEYNGVFRAYVDGVTYLFHNRCAGTGKKNEDNICELDKGGIKTSDVVCTAIDPSGKITTTTLFNNKGAQSIFSPRNSKQLEDGRIILYCFEGGNQRLVEVLTK